MENAAEALKMAAAVLIFVVALSIAINSFGQARQTAQLILDYTDREYDYTYVEENKDSNGDVMTERIVSLESIIPTIYKAYRENFKIVFDGCEALLEDEGLFSEKNEDTGKMEKVYKIDLENETIGTDTLKEQFLMAILYGNKIDDFQTIKDTFKKTGIELNSKGLCDKINTSKFKEEIGIYYQEQAGIDNTNTTDTEEVPESNLTEKRVITYTPV